MCCGLRPLLFVFAFAVGDLSGQQTGWQPSPGLNQVPIWPTSVPDSEPVPGAAAPTETKELVAGRPWIYVTNVSRSTITVDSPKGTNTGAAVVVFPGGGYQISAIDLEGTEVCDWLTSRGKCVLLKYRVSGSGMQWDAQCRCQVQAEDDNVDYVNHSLVYYIALKNAGGPRRDAFLCTGQACVRLAAHDNSGDGMAPVGRDMARNHRNDF